MQRYLDTCFTVCRYWYGKGKIRFTCTAKHTKHVHVLEYFKVLHATNSKR